MANKNKTFVITQSEASTTERGNIRQIFKEVIIVTPPEEINLIARNFDPAFYKLNGNRLLIGDRLTYANGQYIWSMQRIK